MIKEIKCDVLKSDADFILHQVNLQGIMGGGLALQIANEYPHIEKEYQNFKDKRLGNILISKVNENKYIVNMFSQDMNFNTDLRALRRSLVYLGLYITKTKKFWGENGLVCTVAIPKNYGCGIANGNWQKVYSVFEKWHNDFLENYRVDNLTLLICEL